MFTGIIETIGEITDIRTSGTNKTFTIVSDISHALKVDQSVSHNGVCLTVEKCDEQIHEVTLILETLERSNLNNSKIGDLVNLERCMRMNDRLDGHIVQGHVDTTVSCRNKQSQDGSWVFTFDLPETYSGLIVMKGSICINGISLTVSGLKDSTFEVSIIPYTYENTNIEKVNIGDLINIEFDILGKYVQRNLQAQTAIRH